MLDDSMIFGPPQVPRRNNHLARKPALVRRMAPLGEQRLNSYNVGGWPNPAGRSSDEKLDTSDAEGVFDSNKNYSNSEGLL